MNQPVTALDPVVVVGQSSAERISAGALGSRSALDTPFSLSVMDHKSLEDGQPASLTDVFFSDPGVSAAANPYASGRLSPIRVRGMLVDWRNFRLNGIPADSWGFEWPLELIEQVEILKGTTGFLHGFGVPGGMVNYRTKQPLPEPSLSAQVNWRTASVFSESLDYSDRAVNEGWFGYRANVLHESGGTYNGGEIEQIAGAVSLEARMHESLRLHGEFIHLDRRLSREAPEFGFAFYDDRIAPGLVSGSRDFSIDGTYWDVEYAVATGGMVFTPHPGWTFSVNYAWSEKEAQRKKPFAEVTHSSGDYTLFNYQFDGVILRHFAQGLIEGKFDTGSVSHQLVGGVTWEQARTDASEENYDVLGRGNLHAGNTAPRRFTPHDPQTSLLNEVTQTSVFLSDTAEFLPGLSVLAGLRWGDYEQITRATDYRKSEVTPTVALLYKPRPSTTLYASYVEALEPGSVVGGPRYVNEGETLPPMVSEQYETGIKTEQPGWSGSLSLFRMERAAEIDERVSARLLKRTQDGLAVYQGVEASAEVEISDRLSVSGGFLWLDAVYEELSTAQAWREGERVELTPRYQAALMADYELPGIKGLSAQAGLRWQDGFDVVSAGDRQMRFPAYMIVQAGVRYATQLAGHEVEWKLDVNNVLDEEAWTAAGLLPPLMVALGVRVKW